MILKEMRFRHVYMGLGSLFVILAWVLTDPDIGYIDELPVGSSTIATLIILLKSILYVGVLHVSRKALFDYLDLGTVIQKAMTTSTGSGYVAIAIGLAMIAISITMLAATSS